ncbi:GNAT family N-acetyltransferase [Mariniflexile sp.]|uniref:GNAT family N-acetyltransferase n=1 Tax=Mariniflexile sp. TaxID=1979402 RepID=UPI0040488B51
MNDIKIIHLTKKVLRDYLDNDVYWYNQTTVFPKSKVCWLVNNDRMAEDDYCGVVAEENNKIVGFIYMVPDLVKVQNNEEEESKKIYWMVNWWIHNKYNGNVLSTYIYNEALSLAKNQVIVKFFAANTAPFYKKRPFKTIASYYRYTIFFSADPSVLVNKFSFLKPFKPILNIADQFVSKSLQVYNLHKLKTRTQHLNYEYLNELDKQTWHFIEPLCENDFISKTKVYVNWQISRQQYTQTPVGPKNPYTSLETGVASNIAIHNLKILKNNVIIGFVSFLIYYNECNVKYFLVEDDSNFDLCVDALIENMMILKRKYICTDDTRLAENIRKRNTTIFTHRALRKTLAHNDVNINFENRTILQRDGHFY